MIFFLNPSANLCLLTGEFNSFNVIIGKIRFNLHLFCYLFSVCLMSFVFLNSSMTDFFCVNRYSIMCHFNSLVLFLVFYCIFLNYFLSGFLGITINILRSISHIDSICNLNSSLPCNIVYYQVPEIRRWT